MVTCFSPEKAGSHMSRATASPQIPESVTGPTNFVAEAVMSGRTRAPAAMRRRATSTLL